jgi:DNA-binding transcriptional MerR regulator
MQQLSIFDQITPPQEEIKKELVVDTDKLTKVYYTITEVAEMFNVNASLLRFWEKEFPVQLGHLKKNKKGDRFYNKNDIAKLKIIYHLVKEKRMTLEGARANLKDHKKKAKTDFNLIENLETVKRFLIDLKKSLPDD